MKKLFKRESLVMALVLAFYGFIAGGSVDDESIKYVIIIVVVLLVIIGFIFYVDNQNKEKRLKLKEDFESQEKDFDLSDKLGNDRVGLYFDKEKEKALILSISNEGVKKHYVDDFKKTHEKHFLGDYCIIDDDKRKALLVQSFEEYFKHNVVNYGENDENKDVKVNNVIPTALYKPSSLTSSILVEEKFGYITIFDSCYAKSFNYISGDMLLKKKGDVSFITKREINSYVFLMDNFFKVLIIISPRLYTSYKVLSYTDIINVTYEEDGIILFSKSTARTVGGTLVGGALMGGSGAIVGGLSGDFSQNKTVQTMNIKILVRSTTEPSINLPINGSKEIFNTKDENSRKRYQTHIKQANAIKDLISVIIDNSNQQTMSFFDSRKIEYSQLDTGVADELVKLAQLKDTGILSEEEFQMQKRKLLNR